MNQAPVSGKGVWELGPRRVQIKWKNQGLGIGKGAKNIRIFQYILIVNVSFIFSLHNNESLSDLTLYKNLVFL